MRALMSALLLGCVGGRRAEPSPEPGEPTDAVERAEPAEAPDRLEGGVRVAAPPRDPEVSGDPPLRSEAEVTAEVEAHRGCIETCLQTRQAEARAIELIEADCGASCQRAHPSVQVEVIPGLAPATLPGG